MPFNSPSLPTLSQRHHEEIRAAAAAAATPSSSESTLQRWVRQANQKSLQVANMALEFSEKVARATAPDDQCFMPGTKQECLGHLRSSGLFPEDDLRRLLDHEVLLNFDASIGRHLKKERLHELNLDVRQAERAQDSIRAATEALTDGYQGPSDAWKTTTGMLIEHQMSPLRDYIKKLKPIEQKDRIVENACKRAIEAVSPEITADHPSHQARMNAFVEKMSDPESSLVEQYRTTINTIGEVPTTLERQGKISKNECDYLKGAYQSYALVARGFLNKATSVRKSPSPDSKDQAGNRQSQVNSR